MHHFEINLLAYEVVSSGFICLFLSIIISEPMKTIRLFLIFSYLFGSFYQLSAQAQNIMISDVSNPEEPSIFINPKNPAMIMAAANLHSLYISQDSGYTWTRTPMTSQSGVWGDPCIVADTAGNFYFLHLANPPSGTGNWIDRIVCQKYDVGLNLWTEDMYMGLNGTKAQDKEWMAVDPKTNNLYVSWTQFDDYGSSLSTDSSHILFSRSTDGGHSWSSPVRLDQKGGDCIDSDSTVEGAVPAVGPQGEVYVSWAGPQGLMFDRSTDGGQSWLNQDIFVSSIPDGWDYEIPGISRANGLPITACDLSGGPHHGTIYINWSDQRNGLNNTDVWLVKSTDGGNSWSSPLKVNNDSGQSQQFFTWMTIDQVSGYIYIVFYDRRNYSNELTDVYLAVSRDGGSSFDNHRISKSPFLPSSNVFFGDYTNISAYNGMVRPIWTRLNNDSLSVWTALIEDKIEIPQVNQTVESNAYPNPAKENIAFSFKIKQKSKVHLQVVNNEGKVITTLINNEILSEGMYVKRFNFRGLNLASGLYYFDLKVNDNEKQSKKFIITKE